MLLALSVVVQLAVLYWPRTGPGPGVQHLDKVVHAAVFGAVAFTGGRAGVPWRPLLLLLAAHAGVSELLQGALLPRRSADGWDVLADLLGTVAGALAGGVLSGSRPGTRGGR